MDISQDDSPHAKAEALGARLKQARLNRDMTQTELSGETGITRKMIMNAEKGQVSLVDLIAMLDALGVKNNLDAILPHQPISPIQLLKLQGKSRKKASGRNKKEPTKIETAKVDAGW